MGNMKVFTTAEVVIGNCDTLSFTREIDDETGFDELVVREKQKLTFSTVMTYSRSFVSERN